MTFMSSYLWRSLTANVIYPAYAEQIMVSLSAPRYNKVVYLDNNRRAEREFIIVVIERRGFLPPLFLSF